MDIITTREKDTLIAELKGRLESSNADEFQRAIVDALEPKDKALVIDLTQLSYVSSAGLRSFALVAKATKSTNIPFAICCLTQNVMDVFNTSGFSHFIAVHEDRPSAVSAVQR